MSWISVKDQLPPINQVVLISYPIGKGIPHNIAFGGRVDYDDGWCWGLCYGGVQLAGKDDIETDDEYLVTHWMALEAPPAM